MTRAEFLAERRTGIGSSDAASLMNVGYGCKRRLWYDKVGVPADYERETTKGMKLGKLMEPYFIQEYREATGREVQETGESEAFRHPEYHFLLSHPDGIIREPKYPDMIGTLEIKSMDNGAFWKTKREGMMEDYILQKQWTMMVIGNQFGAFGAGARGSGDLIQWDVARNLDLISMLKSEGVEFWKTVEASRDLINGQGCLQWEPSTGMGAAEAIAPPRLSPDDARCHRCEWRDTCQGNALMEISESDKGESVERNDLLPLYSEYKQRKALLTQAEDLAEETAEELKTKIGDAPRVTINGRKVHYAPQTTMRWDGKELAEYVDRLRARLVWAENDFGKEFIAKWPKPEKKAGISRPFRVY